jgi:murein DD-endopeptidase MepM/ murein hydrolase activator NlpD
VAAAAPNADTASASPAAAAPAPPTAAPEPPVASNATPAPAQSGGAFLWPVRGRVLAAYGSKTDGTHNDGINIGAPKGAAVQAADAGVVAYTGNELRGYGNLILVKHPNGWISAYAHCDLILVKRGEKVVRGQVIARVGSTGNVGEPQLHFELRRGNHPVDPREFLAPLPTADGKDSRTG